MLREVSTLRFFRKGSQKNTLEEIENASKDVADSTVATNVLVGRAPLSPISEPGQKPPSGPVLENPPPTGKADSPAKVKPRRTSSKMDLSSLEMTPEKQSSNAKTSNRNRFGWAQKQDTLSTAGRKTPFSKDKHDESSGDAGFVPRSLTYTGPAEAHPNSGILQKTNIGSGNGTNCGSCHATPRPIKTGGGRSTSNQSDGGSSTSSTPTNSVSRPPNSFNNGFKVPSSQASSARSGHHSSKNLHIIPAIPTVVNTVEVPHFDLKEDPSFWMDHNIQVLVRVRPLNSAEIAVQAYNRCLKQESNSCLTWLGPPESRFTFDHVAGETITQDMLFKVAGLPMVENCMSGYNSCMFAYGQTGSGKTHTMLGDIEELDRHPGENRGMTPRIFEYLFARIKAEEESHQQEHMRYICRCSFLEIYNEQIADLLEPSSTNLQLREDSHRGVYVENLTEIEVKSVHDVIQLLLSGAANRRVAATSMNRESSRSHSVFTCVIESHWEKDAMTNIRYGRLNLVDLAGSERQKVSGAEGDRLKEAANINKSLSTLGLVIMILVDVAQGKQRHIPYRDSRLTFLLQHSLGGNSKTTIIANVSPSICSAHETLSTLKFAQRAKHIQNNAVINEDASGNVLALQRQVQQLQDELRLLKHQNVSRSLSFRSTIYPETVTNSDLEELFNRKLKTLESTLAGALRREQEAENEVRRLENQIEHLNVLVNQRDEDIQCTKMMLRFREDKIKRLEAVTSNLQSADEYMLQEISDLNQELQNLQTRKHPELASFAMKNIKLSDQLKRFQNFYEGGEREVLLSEISDLRDQLAEVLQEKLGHETDPCAPSMSNIRGVRKELEECKIQLTKSLESNERLNKEIDNLQTHIEELKKICNNQAEELTTLTAEKAQKEHKTQIRHSEEIAKYRFELESVQSILEEERLHKEKAEEHVAALNQELDAANNKCLQMSKDLESALEKIEEGKTIIDALESQQLFSIKEVLNLDERNNDLMQVLGRKEEECHVLTTKNEHLQKQLKKHKESHALDNNEGYRDSPVHGNLERMYVAIEKAKKLNSKLQNDPGSGSSHDEEIEVVQKQVEEEMANLIISMQKELQMLHDEIESITARESHANQENIKLKEEINSLHEAIRMAREENQSLKEEWEKAAAELTTYLKEGDQALANASEHMDIILDSFPQKSVNITYTVDKIVAVLVEKDKTIETLQSKLQYVKSSVCVTERKMKCLKEAALAITEAQKEEYDEIAKEVVKLKSDIMEKDLIMEEMVQKVEWYKRSIIVANRRLLAAFIALGNSQKLYDVKKEEQVANSLEQKLLCDNVVTDLRKQLTEALTQIDYQNQEILQIKGDRDELKIALASEKSILKSVHEKEILQQEEFQELEYQAESFWRESFEANTVLCLISNAVDTFGKGIHCGMEEQFEELEETRRALKNVQDEKNELIASFISMYMLANNMQEKYSRLAKKRKERLEIAQYELHQKDEKISEMTKALHALEVNMAEMVLQKEEAIASAKMQMDLQKREFQELEWQAETSWKEAFEANTVLCLTSDAVDTLRKNSHSGMEDVDVVEKLNELEETKKTLKEVQYEKNKLVVGFVAMDVFAKELLQKYGKLARKRKERLETAEHELHQKNEKISEMARAIQALEVTMAELVSQKDELTASAEKASLTCSDMEKELQTAKHELANIHEKLDDAQNHILLLQNKLDECTHQAATLDEERLRILTDMEIKKCQWADEKQQFQSEKMAFEEEMQSKLECAEKQLSELTTTVDSLLQQKCKWDVEKQDLLKNEADATFNISKKNEELLSLQCTLAEVQTNLQEAKKKVKSLYLLLEEYKNAEECKEREREDLLSKIEHLHTELVAKEIELEVRRCESIPKNALLEELKNWEVESQNLRQTLVEKDQAILSATKEMEDALECLDKAKQEVKRTNAEKDKLIETKKILTCTANQLQEQVNKKEREYQSVQQEMIKLLQQFEIKLKAAEDEWKKEKEMLSHELSDSRASAAEKAHEAAILLKRFKDSEEVINEANIMLNALLKANESAKCDTERWRNVEQELVTERCSLIAEIQKAKICFEEKEHEFSLIQKENEIMLNEATEMISTVAEHAKSLKADTEAGLMALGRSIGDLKSDVMKASQVPRSWLEEMWLLALQKDIVYSVIIEGQREMLQSNMEKIKEYSKNSRDIERQNSLLQKECQGFRSIISELQNDLRNSESERTFEAVRSEKDFDKQSQMLKFDVSSLKKKNESLRNQIVGKDNEITSLNEELKKAFSKAEILESENCDISDRLNRSLRQMQKSADKVATLETEEVRLKETVSSLMAEHEQTHESSAYLQKQLQDISSEKDHEIETLLKQLHESSRELKLLEQKNAELQDRLNSLENSLKTLEAEFENKSQDLERCELAHSNVLEELNRKSMENQELMELKKSLIKEVEGKELLILEVQQSKDLVETVKMDNSASKEALKQRESELSRLTEENRSLNEKISSQIEENREILNEINLKDDSLHQLEALLWKTANDNIRHMAAVEELESRFSHVLKRVSPAMSTQGANKIRGASLENISEHYSEIQDKMLEYISRVEKLEESYRELASKNLSLSTELLRKEELLKGLHFDLSLLQESASKAKDQKDEIQKASAALKIAQEDLQATHEELQSAIRYNEDLEKKLLIKESELKRVNSEVDSVREEMASIMKENSELETIMRNLEVAKISAEENLEEKKKIIEGLEEELQEMNSMVDQQIQPSLESMKHELNTIARERDDLHAEVLAVTEQLEMANAFAEERDAVAAEATQLAEERRAYAELKDEEAKLLERSIEELERTVNALESQVDIVRGEAERHRLKREDLEIEVQALKHQIAALQRLQMSANSQCSSDSTFRSFIQSRPTFDNNVELHEALRKIRSLEMLLETRDTEIRNCKAHIEELVNTAEAQAKEHQQKYKELEEMAKQVRSEQTHSDYLAQAVAKSSDKATTRTRGSSSPFKCIGLGFVQQMNMEKEEELVGLRRRIQELEGIAEDRQKEIFKLNTKLATAESMTHDVLRDLLGVKLDITNATSKVNLQQVHQIVEKSKVQKEESKAKDNEIQLLKSQLNDFIEERESWLEEISRRQAEMMAAKVTAEKLRRREQFLSTENDLLKNDNGNQKRTIVELEQEIKKLSGQQNLQQRIHHHAKIKEENNLLRAQHDELVGKLKRTEAHLERLKEEVARCRTAQGKSPFINVDEEQRLRKLLEETEEEKFQISEKLANLCSDIFQAAGVRPQNGIEPSIAIQTLYEMKERIESTERELMDTRLKTRMAGEKKRLSELRQLTNSPVSSYGNHSFSTVQSSSSPRVP